MDYCVNDISWLQKSISSMEDKGLSPRGRIVATEIIKPTGEKAVNLKIDGIEKVFSSPIEAVDYIVEYNMESARRFLAVRSILTGAGIGAAVAVTTKTDILWGVSVGTVIALISNHFLPKGSK